MKRVYLEITDACNLDCPFCTNEKGDHFLSLDEIDDYTSQIRPYCRYLYLHMLGEPLLHPEFHRILDLLDEKDFFLQLVTNGTLLKRYPDILKHRCLRKLSVSLHSINSLEVSEGYFETIDDLLDQETDAVIELRFYDHDHLSDQLKNYLQSLQERYHPLTTSRKDSYRFKDNVYIAFSDFFRWPSLRDPVIGREGRCHGGIDMIAINSQSEVTLCCLDPKAYNSLGNLKKRSLSEILNDERYLSILEEMKQGKITSDLCSRCTYRLRFR